MSNQVKCESCGHEYSLLKFENCPFCGFKKSNSFILSERTVSIKELILEAINKTKIEDYELQNLENIFYLIITNKSSSQVSQKDMSLLPCEDVRETQGEAITSNTDVEVEVRDSTLKSTSSPVFFPLTEDNKKTLLSREEDGEDYGFKVNKTLSALNGLRQGFLNYFEESTLCDCCKNKINILFYYDIENKFYCYNCWINKWFPVIK